MRWLLCLAALLLAPGVSLAQTPTLDGNWLGLITTPTGQQLHLALHLGQINTLDSPDQNATGLPLIVDRHGDQVVLTAPTIHGEFHLTLAADSLTGSLSQGSKSLLVTFRHGSIAPPNRPQTPKPPFPYREIQVRYPNPKAPGVVLAGTLTLPQGEGPFPVALMITGSGAQDRDETIFDHKPFAIIADALTRRGVAVLRLDDRGVGGSTGATANDTSLSYATDVEAGVAWLKTRPDVDAKKIGLIGHSEGGMIAAMVAAKDPTIDYVVLLAGPGLPGVDLITEQVRFANLAAGATPATADVNADFERRLLVAIETAPDGPAAIAAGRKILPSADLASLQVMASPWYRYFLAHDPAPDLRAIKVPILALNGSKDADVSALQNLPAIKAAAPQAQTVELSGLNHLFQTAKTGMPSEYGQIEESFAHSALSLLTDWVVKTVSQP